MKTEKQSSGTSPAMINLIRYELSVVGRRKNQPIREESELPATVSMLSAIA
jgi:hypothetical protein